MGMYTEIALNISLREDTPESVLSILEKMATGEDETIERPLPDHAFFKCDRWHHLMIMGSCYFHGLSLSKYKWRDCGVSALSFRSNLKNYDDEILKFLGWITPYVDPDDHAGYFRYEEDDNPTLIYFEYNDDLSTKLSLLPVTRETT